jgi:hypothetical protein
MLASVLVQIYQFRSAFGRLNRCINDFVWRSYEGYDGTIVICVRFVIEQDRSGDCFYRRNYPINDFGVAAFAEVRYALNYFSQSNLLVVNPNPFARGLQLAFRQQLNRQWHTS